MRPATLLNLCEAAYDKRRAARLNGVVVDPVGMGGRAVYLERPNERWQVVVIRGTAGGGPALVSNIVDDLLGFKSAPTRLAPGMGKVHAGFLRHFAALWPDLADLIDPSRPLIVTGFSLGGGVAPLVGLAAKDLLNIDKVRVVTFGAPACADAQFSGYMEMRMPLLHVQLPGDPITWATRPLGFKHAGRITQLQRPKGWRLHTHNRNLYREALR